MEYLRPHETKASDELRIIGLELLVSGTVGALVGICQGVPAATQREYLAAMNRALQAEPLPHAIQGELLRLVAQKPSPNIILLPSANAAWPTNHSTKARVQFVQSYRTSTNQEVDSILLTHIVNQWFEAPVALNPKMTFAIALEVELIRVSDGALLYERQFEYRGRSYYFTRWAENDARRFRVELKDAKIILAEIIAERLLLLESPK